MGAPPTNQHRIEMLEQGLGDLRTTMAEQILVSVQAATQEMQKSLITQLTNSLEQTSQRLEDRIARSREKQDVFMNLLKGEQEKFQEEIRSTLTSNKPTETLQGEIVKPSLEFRSGQGRLGSFVDEEGGSGVGSGRFGDVGFGSGRRDANGSGRGLEFRGNTSHIHTGGLIGDLKNWIYPHLKGLILMDGSYEQSGTSNSIG